MKATMKKLVALTLAGAMILGSSLTVLADDPQSGYAGGSGTSFDHVNKDIIKVTLPTTSETALNYIVDPERLINDAGELTNGTAVTANSDGVYFTNAAKAGTASATIAAETEDVEGQPYSVTIDDLSKNAEYMYDGEEWQVNNGGDYVDTTVTITIKRKDGTSATLAEGDTAKVTGAVTAGYSQNSDTFTFTGENSATVDVSVAASITPSAGGKDIALVADDAALTTAEGPALLLKMTLGSSGTPVAITSEGAEATTTLEGIPANFAVAVVNGKYVYQVRTNTTEVALTDWKTTTLSLSGKTNTKPVPDGTGAMTAPKVKLTWTIGQHETVAPGIAATAVFYKDSTDDLALEMTNTTEVVNNSVKIDDTDVAKDSGYTFAEGTLTIKNSVLAALGDGEHELTLKAKGGELTSEGKDLTVTITKRAKLSDPSVTAPEAFTEGPDEDLVLTTANMTSISDIKLDDTEVAEDKYGFVAADNELTLDKSLFATAGEYTLTFKASNADVTDKEISVTITVNAAVQVMHVYWDNSGSCYWAGTTANSGFDTDATTITALTVNGKDVKAGSSVITGTSDGKKWVKIPWSACTAAGVASGQSSYAFTLTLGGVNYAYTVE